MLKVITTIIPIFVVILLGWLLRWRGILPFDLTKPLNRIVYYIAIPALIFREVAGASFEASFSLDLLVGTLVPLIALFFIGVGVGRLFSFRRRELGTFTQTCFHGNLGYIGLAVAFYFLGKDGLTRAGILAGFLLLFQNFLGVISLQMNAARPEKGYQFFFICKKVFANPVILSALAGIFFSVSGIKIPQTLDRSLEILSGMALPLALLVIGASLSFDLIKSHLRPALSAAFLKLVVLPGLGILMYLFLGISASQFLPGLILLAAPTATITYVMAAEMKGSPELASATVSVSTILSCFSFIFWLGRFG